MKLKVNTKQKSEFTRRCIGEAIVKSLKTTPYNKLSISDISKLAGVSRTTFYTYYTTPYSSLEDYLNIIVAEYLSNTELLNNKRNYMDSSHIVFSFEFFDQYSDFFVTLADNGLHSLLLNGINSFLEKNILRDSHLSIYKMYSYGGAILNTFLKWEENQKKDSVQDIAKTLEALFSGTPT